MNYPLQYVTGHEYNGRKCLNNENNSIPESEDSKEMTVIFELLVQTQLIISHLTGKSIKLYGMGIIAHFNLYWFN